MQNAIGLVKRHWKPITAISLAVMILIVVGVFYLGQPSLAKYKAMAEQGDIEGSRAGLLKALNRKPKWHAGREFLVELELESKNYAEAAKHMVVLARAGRNTAKFEDTLVEEKAVAALEELAKAFSVQWHWPRLLYVRLALATDEHSKALAQIVILADLEVDINSWLSQVLAAVDEDTEIDGLVALLEGEAPWQRELALQIALKKGKLSYIVNAAEKLYQVAPQHPLISEAGQLLWGKTVNWWLGPRRKSGGRVLRRLSVSTTCFPAGS